MKRKTISAFKYLAVLLIGIILTTIYFTFFTETKYTSFKNMIEATYDGEVDDEFMQNSIYRGIVAGLDDPHSTYLTDHEYQQFNSSLDESYKGIGITIAQNLEEEVIIASVKENSPAVTAELYPGDIIHDIDGEEIDDETTEEVVNLIKDGDNSSIEVYRPSTNETVTKDIVLESVENQTVTSDILTKDKEKYGLIKITTFGETTADEFETELSTLEEQKIKGLIIDVRDNGGGYLQAVEDVMNLIVPNTKPAVVEKSKDKVVDSFTTTLKEQKEYPITLVQNENSASASEILSGALLEGNDSEIVGTQSYGKGSVQTTQKVDGGWVKLTIAHWYTPDDNIIDGVGITPTVKLNEDEVISYGVQAPLDEELILNSRGTFVEYLNDNLYILGYDVDAKSDEFTKETEKAVKKFQAENDLNVTGTVDSITMYHICVSASTEGLQKGRDPFIEEALKTFKE